MGVALSLISAQDSVKTGAALGNFDAWIEFGSAFAGMTCIIFSNLGQFHTGM
jgi:hypothetical protein